MADKFDEGFFNEEPQCAFWSQQVDQREDREEQADNEAHDQLNCPVTAPPTRKAIIPLCGQELLTVWLCHKLEEKKRERFVNGF